MVIWDLIDDVWKYLLLIWPISSMASWEDEAGQALTSHRAWLALCSGFSGFCCLYDMLNSQVSGTFFISIKNKYLYSAYYASGTTDNIYRPHFAV